MDDRAQRRRHIEAQLDRLGRVWEARQRACRDESIRGLRPCGLDWCSPEEFWRWGELQSALQAVQETTVEIQARVAAKRAARVAARGNVV
jgi:hypothetical protein